MDQLIVNQKTESLETIRRSIYHLSGSFVAITPNESVMLARRWILYMMHRHSSFQQKMLERNVNQWYTMYGVQVLVGTTD